MNPYDIAPILERISVQETRSTDYIFSPGYAPRAIIDGQLAPFPMKELKTMSPYQIEMLAMGILKDKPRALARYLESGSVVTTFQLGETGRFRVHIFRQRNMPSVIMRVIAGIPTFESLSLPSAVGGLIEHPFGLSLVTGSAGSGRRSVVAAAVNLVNQLHGYHIVTVEDPIEHIYPPGRGLIHQREVGTDASSLAAGLKEAFQMGPRVIMTSYLHNRECIELALQAAEAGCLVLSTMPAASPARAIETIIGAFPKKQEPMIRGCLSQALRCIVSLRLVPRKDGKGYLPLAEILRPNTRTRDWIANESQPEEVLTRAIQEGAMDGMQTFAVDAARWLQEKLVAKEVVAPFMPNPGKRAEVAATPVRAKKSGPREFEIDGIETLHDMPILGLDES